MSAISAVSDASFGTFSRPRLAGRWDRRTLRIAFLIASVALLNGFDLVYTLFADNFSRDSFHEMNPLAAGFLQMGLVPSLICFKVLMVSCGLGLLWKVRQSRWALPACWVLLIAYLGLTFMWCVWAHDVNQTMDLQLTMSAPK